MDESSAATFQMICEQIKTEMQQPGLQQYELLVSYLKIFLITATRLKTQQHPAAAMIKDNKEPFILQKLKSGHGVMKTKIIGVRCDVIIIYKDLGNGHYLSCA